MTVREAIKLLSQYDPDDILVLAEDAAANSLSPLSHMETEYYVPRTKWWGECYIRELTPELRKRGFTEDDIYDGTDGQNAVILYPTN